jgi:hypothetical protein
MGGQAADGSAPKARVTGAAALSLVLLGVVLRASLASDSAPPSR